jgi:hypothetical protein
MENTMKEAKFIGSLMPSHPDFQPIIQEIREKYQLPEVDPDGEPISEIYLGDEIIPLEDFRKELKDLLTESLDYLPEQVMQLYRSGKTFVNKPIQENQEYQLIPDSLKAPMETLYIMAQNQSKLIIDAVDKHYQAIADMLYVYLLTGEVEESPDNWIGIVTPAKIFDTEVIFTVSNQIADPEVIVQQFRDTYAKAFGKHHPKITKNAVSTAYYLQLKRNKKPWNFIVEEFIRLNNFKLPRDKTSARYVQTRRKYEQLLKKRMQRTETVLNVLVGDKK